MFLVQETSEMKNILILFSFKLTHNGEWSSRQREFHPKPLTEPYVTVSRHTALVIQIYTLYPHNPICQW